MAQTLEQFFSDQREKFTKQREDALAKLQEAESELRALDAYENAKKGIAPTISTEPKRRGPQKGTKRDGGKRAEVLDLIRRSPSGITSGEISEQLNATDKAGKQSVANALSALKNDGLISQAQKRGPYTITPAPE